MKDTLQQISLSTKIWNRHFSHWSFQEDTHILCESKIMANLTLSDAQETMRQEKHLIKSHARSDLGIRADQRLIKYPKKETQKPLHFHAHTLKIEYNQADIAASFQKAVTDVLVANAMHAVEEFHVDKLAIAGGVASNSALRAAMKEACEKRGVEFYYPSPIFCTDNAAMIGVAAYYEYINGTRSGWDLNAVPNLKLGER